MSAYTGGTAFGMMLARRLPYKIRIALGLLLTLFLLVVLGLCIYKSSLEKNTLKTVICCLNPQSDTKRCSEIFTDCLLS